MEAIEIQPCGRIQASVRPPGSKSITNRALICAALADGRSVLSGALDSEDTQVMIAALNDLGITVDAADPGRLVVEGGGGVVSRHEADLYVANSGTTVRFLTAMLATMHGNFRLDGVPRMRERPIGDLLDALNQLGGDVRSELDTGAPPVLITAAGMLGGEATISGSVSSQYLSGLLMAAPNARGNVCCRIDGPLVSRPYIQITLEVMRAFGVQVGVRGNLSEDAKLAFDVRAPQKYAPREYAIEPDASAASYFWAAAAICSGQVLVEGLRADALQGDTAFCDCLRQMGCEVEDTPQGLTVRRDPQRQLVGIDVDMNAISDTVQTLAAVALFAEGPTRVRGVAHNRHKETDRIADLARELRKVGADVVEHEDGLTIQPGELRPARLKTYGDHRMAMSLALIGLATPGIEILDPQCVNKTYPQFFRDLSSVVATQL